MTGMKTMFKFFAAALAIVAAASCAKENTENQSEQPKVRMTFSASIDTEEDTKTTLGADKWVHWSDDDAIRVFYMEGNYLRLNSETFTINPESNDEDPTFADFTGNIVPSSSYFAAYPGNGWSVLPGAAMDYQCFEGLAKQNAVLGSFDPTKHIALSVSTKDNHFYFQNACALAKVQIATDGVYSVKIDGGVVSSGNGAYTEGSIGGNLWFKPGTIELYRAYKASDKNSITLANADGSPLKNGGEYYIVLPVCTIKNFSITICDQNGNAIGTKAKTSNFVVERNKIYNLGALQVGVNYSKGNRVAKASDLNNNGLYIIEYLDGSRNCTNRYWTEMSDGIVNLSSVTDGKFTASYVFKASQSYSGTAIDGQNYAYKFRSSWQSMASGKYISNAFKAEYNTAGQTGVLYTISANGWYDKNQTEADAEKGHDIDMYNGAKTSWRIQYNGESIITNAANCSKWHIYEAVAENTLL